VAPGGAQPSRVCSSLVAAAGLPFLAARDAAEYVDLAVRLVALRPARRRRRRPAPPAAARAGGAAKKKRRGGGSGGGGGAARKPAPAPAPTPAGRIRARLVKGIMRAVSNSDGGQPPAIFDSRVQ
jgi:hypothetical protein